MNILIIQKGIKKKRQRTQKQWVYYKVQNLIHRKFYCLIHIYHTTSGSFILIRYSLPGRDTIQIEKTLSQNFLVPKIVILLIPPER